MEAPTSANVPIGLPARKGGAGGDVWWAVAIPVVAFLVVLFVYPTGTLLLKTFSQFDAPQRTGLDNLTWFLGNTANMTILARTFVVAAVSTCLSALIAFPYAYVMTIVTPRVRTWMLGAVLVSMFLGILLRNFSWVVLLQSTGPVNAVLAWLGVGRVRFLGTVSAVLMGMVHVLFPYMVLPLYSVLQAIDRRLLLAAESLGAPPSKAFVQIYVPLALPGLIAGATLVFVLALGFYITPAVLGSPQQSLMAQVIYSQFERTAAFGRAGAMALVLSIAALVMVALMARVNRRSRLYGGTA
ncbi:ABC transporter permease [Burkholderia stabilis]|uniref:ABC transporter permease n=1 Tax=Burkholderia stabilis TaxID=95485 RepID=UPI001590209A|nr:ABC transporter permease [Burkholderia stabilis]